MTKEEIGAVLKSLRIACNLTQKEVAEMIGRKQQIVGHWETGYAQPDANTLFTLCNIYNTTVDEAFGFSKKNFSFTIEEKQVIEKYRLLDDIGRKRIDFDLDMEAQRSATVADQSERITELEAAQHLLSYKYHIYTYMHKIAAAGVGFYFDDIPTDTIEAPFCDGADFIIGVSGDSMEPTYSDGDLVYVQKRQVIDIGDIGIFIVNGQCYIKEAGENGLISHNPDYKVIPGSEQVNCVGKVLGKVKID